MLRFAAAALVLCTTAACSLIPQTSKNQVRGSVPVIEPKESERKPLEYLNGSDPDDRARQITAEHSSVEYYQNFTLGILEVTDDGVVNPSQKEQVFKMLGNELANGGILVVFVHGWHHGARTCDRDLCCFRTVLNTLKVARERRYADEVKGQRVVGVFIGWRGESVTVKKLNTATIWDRKDKAEFIGRGAAKELLLQINRDIWQPKSEDITMVTVGHSLGGALVFEAAKETLSGNVSDIENQNLKEYRVARANCDRELAWNANVKARRLGFGDLIVLVNPALEAAEYTAFDNDLYDASKKAWSREQLTRASLPYDKNQPYPANQLPVLIAVASQADSAVGTIFPISRTVLFPFKPAVLFHSDQRLGIGHYGPHITHHLGYADPLTKEEREERNPREQARKECDCTMQTPDVMRAIGTPLDLSKTDQHFGANDKYSLKLTEARRKRGWDVNSPYMVIEAEPKIMAEHSDIFNEYFVGFLATFMDAYYQKFERPDRAPCQFTAPSGTQVMP